MYHSGSELEPIVPSGSYHTVWILAATTHFPLDVPFSANQLISVIDEALPQEAIPTSAEVHDAFASSRANAKVSQGKVYSPPSCIERTGRRSEFVRRRDPRLIAKGGGDIYTDKCSECWFARSNTAGCPVRTQALEIMAARH